MSKKLYSFTMLVLVLRLIQQLVCIIQCVQNRTGKADSPLLIHRKTCQHHARPLGIQAAQNFCEVCKSQKKPGVV